VTKVKSRHIDTASVYEIEDEVGRAVNDAIASGEVTRPELFITTKLWLRQFSRDRVVPAARESLTKLGLDYVDLYLVHWPTPFKPDSPLDAPEFDNELDIHAETWSGMEDVQRLGLAKSIGVSNYNAKMIDDVVKVRTFALIYLHYNL